jgi:hypothetical protein
MLESQGAFLQANSAHEERSHGCLGKRVLGNPSLTPQITYYVTLLGNNIAEEKPISYLLYN